MIGGVNTAFVLAGGKSTRMGTDKAFLRWGNETLLQRMLQLTRSVTSEVCIVGDATKFCPFAPTIEDSFRDQGPLGGIHAALCSSKSDLNLIVAVDLPFVTAAFLKYLSGRAQESEAIVIVPRAAERLQPLCAVYRRQFAAVAEESLKRQKNKIDPLFSMVSTRVIEAREMTAAGFSPEMFRNVNTPEDMEEAKRVLSLGNQS